MTKARGKYGNITYMYISKLNCIGKNKAGGLLLNAIMCGIVDSTKSKNILQNDKFVRKFFARESGTALPVAVYLSYRPKNGDQYKQSRTPNYAVVFVMHGLLNASSALFFGTQCSWKKQ